MVPVAFSQELFPSYNVAFLWGGKILFCHLCRVVTTYSISAVFIKKCKKMKSIKTWRTRGINWNESLYIQHKVFHPLHFYNKIPLLPFSWPLTLSFHCSALPNTTTAPKFHPLSECKWLHLQAEDKRSVNHHWHQHISGTYFLGCLVCDLCDASLPVQINPFGSLQRNCCSFDRNSVRAGDNQNMQQLCVCVCVFFVFMFLFFCVRAEHAK